MKKVFVPSRGFLFFYAVQKRGRFTVRVFVPSRGFLFFYVLELQKEVGDCLRFRPLTGISLFL